jgi:HlyD family secretion protein
MDRKIRRRRWTSWRIVSLAVALPLVVFLVWSALVMRGGRPLRVRAERLTIATVTRGEFQEFLPVSSTVVPRTTHYLDAAEGGRVEEVFREAGSLVEEGDEILRLGNSNLLLDIMYREAELYQQSNNLRNTKILMEQNRVQVQRELLELDYEIAQQQRITAGHEALERSFVSRQEYEEARDRLSYFRQRRDLVLAAREQDDRFRRAQIEQLEDSLQRMQSNLEILKRNQGNLVVRAPISGQLTALDAEVGQSKARGDRLGQIDVLDGFRLRAAIDEFHVARVQRGLHGSFTLAGESYEVQVEKVYPQVVDGRFEVDLRFTGAEPAVVRRGQTIRLRLELGDPSEAVLLPNSAFYQSTGGRWAYVLDDSGDTAHRREIALGRKNTRFLEVLDGLLPGERVIISGYEPFGDADRLILGGGS